MTTITVETRLPFDHFLRTLHQLSQAELAQLVDYAATLIADSAPKVNDFQAQLEAMANDPDIQRGLAFTAAI